MTRAGSASCGAGGDGDGEASEDELDEADSSLAGEAGPSHAGEADGVNAGDRAGDGERTRWSRAGAESAPEAALGEADASAFGAGPWHASRGMQRRWRRRGNLHRRANKKIRCIIQ